MEQYVKPMARLLQFQPFECIGDIESVGGEIGDKPDIGIGGSSDVGDKPNFGALPPY